MAKVTGLLQQAYQVKRAAGGVEYASENGSPATKDRYKAPEVKGMDRTKGLGKLQHNLWNNKVMDTVATGLEDFGPAGKFVNSLNPIKYVQNAANHFTDDNWGKGLGSGAQGLLSAATFGTGGLGAIGAKGLGGAARFGAAKLSNPMAARAMGGAGKVFSNAGKQMDYRGVTDLVAKRFPGMKFKGPIGFAENMGTFSALGAASQWGNKPQYLD